MRKNKYILSIILLFVTFYSNGQIKTFISGYIYNTDGYPISDVSITLKDSNNKIIYFNISNKNGYYNLNKPALVINKYLMQVSHIGYETSLIKIKPDESSYQSEINIVLNKRINNLDEIVIKSSLNYKNNKNDTIEFEANSYRKIDDVKLEDLLKNINGFKIDNQGRITYNGTEIEKILIDGDDLADKLYTIISKNLGANFIEKIQILKNYNDNRIIKNISNSNKLAINITIAEKYKNNISGNIDAGATLQDRYDFNENIINISRRFKTILITSLNNIGNLSDQDIQYYFNNGEVDSFKDKIEKNNSIIKSGKIYTPNIGNKYINDNKDFGSYIMNSSRFGSKIKIRTLIGVNENKKNSNSLEDNSIFLPNNDSWDVTNEDSIELKKKNYLGQVVIKHDNLKKNIGTFFFSIIKDDDENKFSKITRIYNTDSILENLVNKSLNYKFFGNETFKLNKNTALIIESGIIKEEYKQNFNVATNRYNSYFKIDSNYRFYTQINNEKKFNKWFNFNIKGKILKINYSYGLSYTLLKKSSDNNLISTSKFDNNINISSGINNLEYQVSKSMLFTTFNSKLLKNGIIDIGGSIAAGKEIKKGNLQNLSNSSILPNYYFNYTYNFSETNSLIAKYESNTRFSDANNFFSNQIISGNSTIINGADTLGLYYNNESSIIYTSLDYYKNSQFRISFFYSNFLKDLTPEYFYNPKFNIISLTPSKNNNNFNFNIYYEKYISEIKSKFITEIIYLNSNQKMIINDQLNKNTLNNIRLQLKHITVMQFPINFETSITSLYSENYSNSRSSDVWQFEGYEKLKLNISKKYLCNLLYSIYNLTPNSTIHNLDFFLTKKLNKNITMSLIGHNLLNNKIILQKYISPYSINYNSYSIVNRYIMAKIAISF